MNVKYLGSRLVQALAVLWGSFTLIYVLLTVMPGDAVSIRFANPDTGLTAEQVEQMRSYYGQDESLLVNYFQTILNFVKGDFGVSLSSGMPVRGLIADALPSTIQLATTAFVAAVLLGALIAWFANYTRWKWLSQLLLATPSLFVSVPTFWLGIMLIQLFSFKLGWVPLLGGSALQSLILPVATLAVPLSAPVAQVFSRSMQAAFAEPFVTVAAAKGASRRWIMQRHVAKYAVLPTLTIAGVILGELIAGSVVTEIVFGRAGIGRLTESSISSQDAPVLQAIVVVSAIVFVAANSLVDVLYTTLDPRIGAQKKVAVK